MTAITSAQKLRVFNAALRIVRESSLATVSDDVEPRYKLDEIWEDSGGAVKACLEMGLWHFAKRSVSHAHSATTSSGLYYEFTFPTDYVRLVGMFSDAYFQVPFRAWRQNGNKWYADITPLYLEYISKDDSWGNDPALWPESFYRVVEAYLAERVSFALTTSTEVKAIAQQALKDALSNAKNLGAMSQPERVAGPNPWASARGGGGASDRGNTGSLTG